MSLLHNRARCENCLNCYRDLNVRQILAFIWKANLLASLAPCTDQLASASLLFIRTTFVGRFRPDKKSKARRAYEQEKKTRANSTSRDYICISQSVFSAEQAWGLDRAKMWVNDWALCARPPLTYSCSFKCRLMNSHEARARSNKSRYDLCSTNIDLLMTRQIPSKASEWRLLLLGRKSFFQLSYLCLRAVYLRRQRESGADETVEGRWKINKF